MGSIPQSNMQSVGQNGIGTVDSVPKQDNIVGNGTAVNNGNVLDTPAATKYSSSFMEVAQMVSEGKTPDDVQVIDDMPPDPNAPQSESKLSPLKKPFEKKQDESKLTWFEQYEKDQAQTVEAIVSSSKKKDQGNGDDNEHDSANDHFES